MWARIEPLLPAQCGRGRPFRDPRQVIEGVVYRYRTGIAWRDLPERFGPWQTVWKRHHRFSLDGTWAEVFTILQAEADAAGEIDWRGSVDFSTSRVYQHGATAQRSSKVPSSYTGGARSNYKKRQRHRGQSSRATCAVEYPSERLR
jgi:transposase